MEQMTQDASRTLSSRPKSGIRAYKAYCSAGKTQTQVMGVFLNSVRAITVFKVLIGDKNQYFDFNLLLLGEIDHSVKASDRLKTRIEKFIKVAAV